MQMMIISLLNNLGVSAEKLSTLAFNCHQNIISFLGSAGKTVSLESIFERLGGALNKVIAVLNALIYFITKFIFQMVDFIQYLAYKLAGISLSNEITFDLPMFRLLTSEPIIKIFLTLFILGVMIIIILAIFAIVKSEYNNATGGNKDGKIENSALKAGKKACYSIFMMVLVPFLVVAGIAFGSIFLSSVNAAINADGTAHTTIGGQIFIASSYNANRYRLYAENGQRIPILYSFDDPFKTGRYKYYSYDELAEIYSNYESGYNDYAMLRDGNYPAFNDTLSYKNGKVLNSNKNYVGYENFVTTPEQYFVMADFIDYAVKNDLDFYIKDANDNEIDWTRMSSELKISGTVFDETAKQLKVSYVDTNNLTGYYSDEYTLVLSPAGFNASSPIVDSINTISELVNILLDDTKELDAEEKLFKLLERVDGSTNVVKWKTEEVSFNGEMFPVYTLTKKYLNSQTGVVETRASINVAKKVSLSDSGADSSGKMVYYILNKNEDGEYTYTNQSIDYYNDGKVYLDELEPVYMYGSWAEKLYNDMKVIYKDINIDNFINYDTWTDSLGKYFSTTDKITDDKVTQFATTLIHPMGLIMSELFLGVAFEDENNILPTEYSFASKYSKDLIQSICYSVSGEIRYLQLSNEIDTFIKLFNGLFTPIMEDLQRIEGFDINGEGEYSVQSYVYRAYLCSVLLTDSGTNYLNQLGQTIYKITNLVNSIANGEKYTFINSDGSLFEVDYEEDKDGKLIPIIEEQADTSAVGKYVYNSEGEKVLVCDINGDITTLSSAIYMPKGSVSRYVRTNDSGFYEIYLSASGKSGYYSKNKADANNLEKEWSNAFDKYFETFYKVKFDGEDKSSEGFAEGGQMLFANSKGEVLDTKDDTHIYVPKSVDGSAYYIDSKKVSYKVDNGKYVVTLGGESYKYEDNADAFNKVFTMACARAYVYMPTDLDTSKDKTTVKLVRAELPYTENYFAVSYYSNPKAGKSWNSEFSPSIAENSDRYTTSPAGGILRDLMQNFFLFKGTPKKSGQNNAYTFNNITKTMQDIITNTILEGADPDSVYYYYILAYKEDKLRVDFNGETAKDEYYYALELPMADILSADTITNSEASEIEKSLESLIKEAIKYEDKKSGKNYKKAISKINSYYKNKVVNAFLNYMSAQVQKGFSVTVNGNQYTVTQAQSTRNFLEFIYGNQLLYNSLCDQLKNKTPMDSLTEFNQMAMESLLWKLNTDRKDVEQLLKKLKSKHDEYKDDYLTDGALKTLFNDTKFLEDLTFTDRDFDIIESAYYVVRGEKLSVNYRMLADVVMDKGNNLWDEIKNVLNTYTEGFVPMVGEYIGKSENFYNSLYNCYLKYAGLGLLLPTDDTNAYEALLRYVELQQEDESLGEGINENYTGIIDKDGTFGYLRQFLKDFGNLCFDLETKSNFGQLAYNKNDNKSLLEINKTSGNSYASEILETLNALLSEVDFGNGEKVSIQKFSGFTRKDGEAITDSIFKDSKFVDFSSQSKYDIYLIYDYYSEILKGYEKQKEDAEKAVSYINKFRNGSYGMQEASLVYSEYILNYLYNFKYTTDITSEEFKNCIYTDYFRSVSTEYTSNDDLTDTDKTNYFFAYIGAFDGFKFGANGTYYYSLSDIQKKIVDDTYTYYEQIKNNILTEDFKAEYNRVLNISNSLYSFIYDGKTVADSKAESVLTPATNYEILAIIDLSRVLDFVGLDFDINKSLKDYRIDALKYLTEFEEYLGETSASIQGRYLSLLYLSCSDYSIDSVGNEVIQPDNYTKQTILKLAGIENRAEEKLVNLEYEINYGNSKSDEKYGSVFIICTYNEATSRFEPFLMASKENSYGVPYSNYLSSALNGETMYYPVIAKGIFDSNGRPTAIRQVNGNIEFYREDVFGFTLSNMFMDNYSSGQEHTSGEYSAGQSIVTSFKKTFSIKNIKDTISDVISFFKGDLTTGEYYGIQSNTIYHLDGGHCNLNYTFNTSTGISLMYLYDYSELNIIILLVASLVLLKAMTTVLYGLISSIFELGIMFAISPGVMSLHSINDKAVSKWRSNFFKSFFVMYGFIVAINAFFILISLINRIGNIMPDIAESSKQILGQTYLFRVVDLGKIIGYLATTFALLTVTTMLNSMNSLFSGELFGFGDVMKSGSSAKSGITNQVAEAKYFASGQQFKDAAVQLADDTLGVIPGVNGLESVRDLRDGHKKKKNTQKAEELYNQMRANGLTDHAAEQARKAYLDALNTPIDEARLRAQNDDKRRKESLTNSRSYKKDGKEKTCPWCHKKYDPKNGKATNCPHCGRSVK